MELNLERPLLFFDIESTGLNIVSDAIIELSFVKILPGGEQRIKTWKIKPWDYVAKRQLPINPAASAVNGVHDEDLVACPTFAEVVDEVVEWIGDSDLAGFNSAKFDLPLLAEEIERVREYTGKQVGINLHEKKMVDVQNIFHQREPRNLKAAHIFYCGCDFEGAHGAEADTVATYEVLKGQLDRSAVVRIVHKRPAAEREHLAVAGTHYLLDVLRIPLPFIRALAGYLETGILPCALVEIENSLVETRDKQPVTVISGDGRDVVAVCLGIVDETLVGRVEPADSLPGTD